MITRVVKMKFKAECVDRFLVLFENVKGAIRQSNGCEELQLLRSIHSNEVFFTYSLWQSEADLEAYRQSELFKNTWATTKAMFSQKAQAWSLNRIDHPDDAYEAD